MIISSITQGFRLTNNNLRLVFIRLAASALNLIVLLIFLAVPAVVAVTYLGFDLAHATNLLPYLVENPMDIFSRYLGLIVLFGLALILYLLFSSVLFLYVLGGILGTLRISALSSGTSLSVFFREGNRNFFRIFWLTALVSPLMIVIPVVFVVSWKIAAAAHSFMAGQGFAGAFLGAFVSLLGVISGIIMISLTLICVVYSVVMCVVRQSGGIDSIRQTVHFLSGKPQALFLYPILLLGVVFLNITFYGIEMSLSTLPVFAIPFSMVFFIANAFFLSYVSVAVWASLVACLSDLGAAAAPAAADLNNPASV